MSTSSNPEKKERSRPQHHGMVSLLYKIEDGILIALLLIMILMAVLQIATILVLLVHAPSLLRRSYDMWLRYRRHQQSIIEV